MTKFKMPVVDYILIVSGILLVLMGLAGCFLPAIPGPPLNYSALLLLHFTSIIQFSARFLLIWAGITIIIAILDNIIPAWGTKKFGGSRHGVWGSLIGLVAGLVFFPPFGIIICPFLGAVIGELSSGKETISSIRSGFGSFVGFIVGIILKLTISGMMTWLFFKELIDKI